MIYEMYVPAQPLASFVTHFNYYKDQSPAHRIDRFLPNGNVEIVIDLTDSPKYIYDDVTLREKQACNKIWISGVRNRYISIPSARDSEMFVINFRKGMVFPFLQRPLSEITDTVVDGDLILDGVFLEIRKMLAEARSVAEMFRIAEEQMMRRFGSVLAINPFVAFAVGAITANPVANNITAIAAKTGYSQKHFINLFREQVGVNPKSFMRIIRFQKAITEIEKYKKISWSNLAGDCGYYDQSHFIDDFRRFSGFTPLEYMRRKNEQLNYVPVG